MLVSILHLDPIAAGTAVTRALLGSSTRGCG